MTRADFRNLLDIVESNNAKRHITFRKSIPLQEILPVTLLSKTRRELEGNVGKLNLYEAARYLSVGLQRCFL